MRRPSLTEVAQVAEVIAAVAVVFSLLYVGRELQSNTAAVRADAMRAVTERSATAVQTLAAQPDLARIKLVGDADPSALSEEESFQYFLWHRGFWLHMQNVLVQYQLDVFDAVVWEGYNNLICNTIAVPGQRSTWPSQRAELGRELVAVVESCPGF
jgi:hypothetical protein